MIPSETLLGVMNPTRPEEIPKNRPSLNLLTSLRTHPILFKEMRARMRGLRSLAALTVFIGLMGIVILLIYSTITSIHNVMQIDALRELGRSIFFTIYSLELIIVCMISPGLTAGAISLEKEQQTYDLLRTTLLSARELVLGKLLAAMSYVVLLLVAAIPLQAIALLFGGLTASEILISQLILFLTALAFGSLGIFYSSWLPKTRLATGAAQFTSLAIVLIIPILLFVLNAFIEKQFALSQQGDLVQVLFFSLIWFVCITNPVLTAIITELFLSENQALYFIPETLHSGATIFIPSPWLGFAVVYPILIVTLLYFAIRNVQHTAKI
jgi:ABC-type transport system involved in multi-copper enzyme maturation permease subunit